MGSVQGLWVILAELRARSLHTACSRIRVGTVGTPREARWPPLPLCSCLSGTQTESSEEALSKIRNPAGGVSSGSPLLWSEAGV